MKLLCDQGGNTDVVETKTVLALEYSIARRSLAKTTLRLSFIVSVSESVLTEVLLTQS